MTRRAKQPSYHRPRSAPPHGAMSAGDISRLLAARIDELVRELLPHGRRQEHVWRAGSVAVRLSRQKLGFWANFGTGDGGDALDLVRAVLDIDTTEAMAWSRRWLGIESNVDDLRSER
jgi:hypothetical protein